MFSNTNEQAPVWPRPFRVTPPSFNGLRMLKLLGLLSTVHLRTLYIITMYTWQKYLRPFSCAVFIHLPLLLPLRNKYKTALEGSNLNAQKSGFSHQSENVHISVPPCAETCSDVEECVETKNRGMTLTNDSQLTCTVIRKLNGGWGSSWNTKGRYDSCR